MSPDDRRTLLTPLRLELIAQRVLEGSTPSAIAVEFEMEEVSVRRGIEMLEAAGRFPTTQKKSRRGRRSTIEMSVSAGLSSACGENRAQRTVSVW